MWAFRSSLLESIRALHTHTLIQLNIVIFNFINDNFKRKKSGKENKNYSQSHIIAKSIWKCIIWDNLFIEPIQFNQRYQITDFSYQSNQIKIVHIFTCFCWRFLIIISLTSHTIFKITDNETKSYYRKKYFLVLVWFSNLTLHYILI